MYSATLPKGAQQLKEFLKQELAKTSIIEPGMIRVEQKLVNSKSLYQFDILQGNSGQTMPTETKLDKNDVFFCWGIGVYLAAFDTTKRSKAVLQTFPNPVIFGAAPGSGTPQVEDLESVYNGNLTVKIGTTQFISQMPTRNFRYVPQTQQNTHISVAPGLGLIQFNQLKPFDGQYEIEKLRFSGLDQIDIRVELNPFTGGSFNYEAATANFENHLVFVAQGFLVKGLAQSVSRLEAGKSGLAGCR